MRLADFILQNTEAILAQWEAFARTIWPGESADPAALRDHAAEILRAAAADMKSAQTTSEQSEKSQGEGVSGANSDAVDNASTIHALGRVRSGFNLLAVVAEYRALRATVIRLWRESGPQPDLADLDDLTRFNESMDQSLTEATRAYTTEVDRSRELFLAILGHDLRHPLSTIRLLSTVMPMQGKLDAEASNMASQIASSAAAMSRMLRDLLDFTGTRLGAAMPLSPTKTDLQTLCGEVIAEMQAGNPQRTLRFRASGDLTGEWDTGRLRQVVANLLGNAIQHGSESSPIDLSVGTDKDDVILSVHNEGSPISRDAIATIFEPMVRGTSRESHRRPGSVGLGLYIAREVVTAHGGTIDVQSTEDAGTTFTARLPRNISAHP